MDILWTGLRTVNRQLQAVSGGVVQPVGAGLFQEAETILTISKTDYVPVASGALRASGFVEPPIVAGTQVSVTLGFGGTAAPYAVIVHEDLTKRHTVGQAKYLELPLKARLQGMPAVLAFRAQEAIRQSIQRLANVERNVLSGRDVNWGQPLFAP